MKLYAIIITFCLTSSLLMCSEKETWKMGKERVPSPSKFVYRLPSQTTKDDPATYFIGIYEFIKNSAEFAAAAAMFQKNSQ